jgi:hypothetical protein
MSYGTFEFLMPSNKNGIQRIEQDFLTCIHPDLCTYKINNQHDKYFEQTLQKIKDAKRELSNQAVKYIEYHKLSPKNILAIAERIATYDNLSLNDFRYIYISSGYNLTFDGVSVPTLPTTLFPGYNEKLRLYGLNAAKYIMENTKICGPTDMIPPENFGEQIESYQKSIELFNQ